MPYRKEGSVPLLPVVLAGRVGRRSLMTDDQGQLPLEASNLDISPEQLWELFEPFVTDGSERRWRTEVARRRRKLLRQAVRRALRGDSRGSGTVISEYDSAWRGIDYGIYDPSRRPPKGTPWEWRGRRILASDVGATRFRQLLLCRLLERLRPARVLEVGCGNGINLILLACRFPHIEFTGLELTSGGHRAARQFQERESLPAGLEDFAPLPLEDKAAFRRIDFRQGDAAALPFEENSFDLVYSVLAIEQMERIRRQVLGEIARVASGHVAMIEPFRDVNRDFWSRLNVYRRDYFRGLIGEMPGYGLKPELVISDFPQEIFLKTCLVVAAKHGAHSVEA